MADTRFFTCGGPFSLDEIAAAAGCAATDEALAPRQFTDVKPLQHAGPKDVSFLDNPKYKDDFAQTKAGACLVSPKFVDVAPKDTITLVTEYPYHAYARVAALFYSAIAASGYRAETASIDETAIIDQTADIDAGAVISARAEIAAGCKIGANAVIGQGVVIGPGTSIGQNTTVQCALIGARTIIHGGVQIGQDGFGFALGPSGHIKVPQLGRVVIGDDVEIGANTTIDRGTGPDTKIGSGTKIDNLVQIAHNVVIGEHCVIVSHTGISGSTELGDFVVLAGQVGVTGHLKIGSGARIAAQSGVMKDVPAGEEQGGSPAKPVRKWLREVASLERMAKKKGKTS